MRMYDWYLCGGGGAGGGGGEVGPLQLLPPGTGRPSEHCLINFVAPSFPPFLLAWFSPSLANCSSMGWRQCENFAR